MESIDEVVEHFESRKNFYVRYHTASTLATIGISLMVTIAGIFKWALVSACLGAVLAALIALERAFAIGDKKAMYKYVLGEAKTLQWDLRDTDSESVRARVKKRSKELLMIASGYDARQIARGRGK